MKQARQIFWNALLLTGASLLMRTVGVAFQVAISNRAGAEAMGLFSLMSGVYGFALTLAAIAGNKTIAGKSYIYPLFPLNLSQLKKRFLRLRLKEETENKPR